jgi:bacillithiol system protein YtxJ
MNIMKNMLSGKEDLDAFFEASMSETLWVFKHSTRCGISFEVLDGLATYLSTNPSFGKVFYLDILANRAVSDRVASRTGIMHQSPQILCIVKGECIFHRSHRAILKFNDYPSFP